MQVPPEKKNSPEARGSKPAHRVFAEKSNGPLRAPRVNLRRGAAEQRPCSPASKRRTRRPQARLLLPRSNGECRWFSLPSESGPDSPPPPESTGRWGNCPRPSSAKRQSFRYVGKFHRAPAVQAVGGPEKSGVRPMAPAGRKSDRSSPHPPHRFSMICKSRAWAEPSLAFPRSFSRTPVGSFPPVPDPRCRSLLGNLRP